MTPRRVPVLVVLALILIGAAVLDRQSSSSPPADADTLRLQVPAAANASAGSSAWYCTGSTATPGSLADGTVVVANAGPKPLAGSITVIPLAGASKAAPFQVAPANHAALHLADVVAAPFASAIVELDGGDVTVELATTGPLGDSVTPCASRGSSQWYFAEGTTTKDATETLLLFNPFPDDAVVNVVFNTDDGQKTPQALTGLSIPGQGMAAIPVGDNVPRLGVVATSITAQRGRIVAARLQTFDGSAGRKGVSIALGSPVVADTWYFPEGKVTDGLTERFQLYNPSRQEAAAELRLSLEQGQAEPIVVAVPAESRVTVTANDEARIPKDVSHSVTAKSVNGVGIVVERTIDAVPASHRTGLAIMPGALVAVNRSAFAAGESDDQTDEWIVLQNPGARSASASITVLANGTRISDPTLQHLDVAAGQRRAVHLTDTIKLPTTPLIIDSSEPIVVERDLFRTKGLGTSMTTGIPLGG
ncbi:MAG: DUF5719 family protein [Actinomycetota bacterium]|nr:DUF5719 family protein [Actinomycetota bacterium]